MKNPNDAEGWDELERFLPEGATEKLPDLEDYGLPEDLSAVDTDDADELLRLAKYMEAAASAFETLMRQLTVNIEQIHAAEENENGPDAPDVAARFDKLFE